jgi:hypothetical protein
MLDAQTKPKRQPPALDEVIVAIKIHHGLAGPISDQLGMSRPNFLRYCKHHSRAAAALADARQAMGDLAESKLFELIEKGHFPAITFYLTHCARDRGYTLPKDTPVTFGDTQNGDTQNNVVIGEINIIAVPSGRFVGSEPGNLERPSILIRRSLDTPDTPAGG